jgi:hypothetical protein
LKPAPLTRLLLNSRRVAEVLGLVHFWIRTYFGAQAKTDPEVARNVELAVDDRIPPREEAIYPYLFAAIYILYVVWHMLDRLPAKRYRAAREGYREMIVTAREVFLSRPTRMRDRKRLRHPLTLLTQTIDGPTNCFPSLHVALVVFSYQVLKDSAEPLVVQAMRRSCLEVCRSTLESKQHSMADVIGGIALSGQIYRGRFEGESFEDLLPEVLPELKPGELEAVRTLLARELKLGELLEPLLGALSGA